MMLLYFIAFLDRANVGYAAMDMNRDLNISKTLFGFGSGAFFLGYFFFELPSNLLLDRFEPAGGSPRIYDQLGASFGGYRLRGGQRAISPGFVSYWVLWKPGSFPA